jgi:hypothetical protein
MSEPKQDVLWPEFVKWCKENGVGDPDTEHESDWMPWWECYKAGAEAGIEDYKDNLDWDSRLE